MSDLLSMRLTMSEDLLQNIDTFKQAVKTRIVRGALRKAAAPIEASAKSRCKRDLGILGDSITTITKDMKDGRIIALIGPQRHIRVPVRIVRWGKNKGKMMIAIPTRYAHLVERGHNIVVNGKTIGRVGPQAYMQPAWDEYGGECALYTFADEMAAGIIRELDRLYAK